MPPNRFSATPTPDCTSKVEFFWASKAASRPGLQHHTTLVRLSSFGLLERLRGQGQLKPKELSILIGLISIEKLALCVILETRSDQFSELLRLQAEPVHRIVPQFWL
jgi:hypothetical protein